MAPRVAARTFAQVLELWEFRARSRRDYPHGSPAKRGLRRSRVRFVVTACSRAPATRRTPREEPRACGRRSSEGLLPRLTSVGVPAPVPGVCGWTHLAPAQIALAKDPNAYV